MSERPYDAEEVLQQLLADDRNLLVGEQDGEQLTERTLVRPVTIVVDKSTLEAEALGPPAAEAVRARTDQREAAANAYQRGE